MATFDYPSVEAHDVAHQILVLIRKAQNDPYGGSLRTGDLEAAINKLLQAAVLRIVDGIYLRGPSLCAWRIWFRLLRVGF